MLKSICSYKVLLPILATGMLYAMPSQAGVGDDLEKAFNSLGGVSNSTEPSSYKGQSAGYYNGGSLYLRSPVHNTQLVTADLPSFSGSCSGIDLHLGGLSYITSAQAKELFNQITSDGMSYATNLAIETFSPMIANTFKDLRNVIQRVNSSNINSCETATGLVGSVFPKTQAAQKAICQDVGSGKAGFFGDYAAARMECGRNGALDRVLDKAANDPGYKKTLLKSMNFAWKAIQGNAFLAKDNELSELFMTITGSLIVIHEKGSDGANAETYLPSMIAEQNLLKTLLHGDSALIYRCDKYGEDECLHPTLDKNITLTRRQSLIHRVEEELRAITVKVRTDSAPLTEREKSFIESTKFPILKILTVQSASVKDNGILDLATYSGIIATDILFKYLAETIDTVEVEYSALQIPEEKKKQFTDALWLVREKLQGMKQDNYQNQQMTLQLIEQTMLLEKKLAASIDSSILSPVNWADSL